MGLVVTPNVPKKAILTELVDTGNFYDGAIMKLIKANISLQGSTTLAALDAIECDFSGYAASSTIVWGTPFFQPSGVPVVVGDAKLFTTADPAPDLNSVYGWYLTNAGGTALLAARLFDSPVILSGPGQGFEVIPSIPEYSLP